MFIFSFFFNCYHRLKLTFLDTYFDIQIVHKQKVNKQTMFVHLGTIYFLLSQTSSAGKLVKFDLSN